MRATVGFFIVNGSLLILTLSHRTKLALTTEPLTWRDITSPGNLEITLHYAPTLYLTALALLLLIAVMVSIRLRSIVPSRPSRAPYIALFLVLLPVISCPFVRETNEVIKPRVDIFMNAIDVRYVPWDLSANVGKNGLLWHLIQTGVAAPIPSADKSQRELFETLRTPLPAHVSRPSNIIVIECESCWHDETHFRKPFRQLEALDLRRFSAVSPAYGGGTVNASFELLTGLPARGPLSGIIFQEYAEDFSSRALTLARQMERVGYHSIAIHPFRRRFWRRDTVFPKFGFRRFISIEDMSHNDSQRWVDDLYLYKSALKQLAERPERNFLFLTTVHTHGPYRIHDDFGEGDYFERLTHALSRLRDFVIEVQAGFPDTLILVVPDHKPILPRFFFERGVVPKDMFLRTGTEADHFQIRSGASQDILGGVQAYVYYADKQRQEDFVRQVHGKPFFCLSKILDDVFIKSGLPAYEFASSKGLCLSYNPPTYRDLVSAYPEWLYAGSLFGDS